MGGLGVLHSPLNTRHMSMIPHYMADVVVVLAVASHPSNEPCRIRQTSVVGFLGRSSHKDSQNCRAQAIILWLHCQAACYAVPYCEFPAVQPAYFMEFTGFTYVDDLQMLLFSQNGFPTFAGFGSTCSFAEHHWWHNAFDPVPWAPNVARIQNNGSVTHT